MIDGNSPNYTALSTSYTAFLPFFKDQSCPAHRLSSPVPVFFLFHHTYFTITVEMPKKTSTTKSADNKAARPAPSTSNSNRASDEPPKKRLKTEPGKPKKQRKPLVPKGTYVLRTDLLDIESDILKVKSDLEFEDSDSDEDDVQDLVDEGVAALGLFPAKVKSLEADSAKRSESLDFIITTCIEAIIDNIVNNVRFGSNLISTIKQCKVGIKHAVKKAMNEDSDVLLGFEEKVKRHFSEAVADAVKIKAERDALKQLEGI